jgi:peptidoglycan hydrolase-like protein with peptidoglycan-binding domain
VSAVSEYRQSASTAGATPSQTGAPPSETGAPPIETDAPPTETGATPGTGAGAGSARRARRRGGAYVLAAGALAVAAGGGTAAFVWGGVGKDQPVGRRGALPPATTTITRGDLVDTESVDGRLTYEDERSVSTRASGMVTWAPAEGATVRRGKPLLEVNDKPVILMYGSVPLYRTLREGIGDGSDVKQLENNLEALGYGDGMTVDKEFTAATAAAVREWQDDRDLPDTGTVDASQVTFQPGAVRISEVKAPVGSQASPGRAPLTVTDTKRVVVVDLDADKQDIARKGAEVTIELPGGDRVEGKIVKVGSVATSRGDDAGEENTPTIEVDVSLSGKGTGNLDQAPVSVEMESARAENVLSVPIEALLALREGGYGVEIVEGGGSRIVAVRTGTYGGGRVEIRGTGLTEGMKVGVPAT